MNSEQLHIAAAAHCFDDRPILQCTTAELEAYSARCTACAIKHSEAGKTMPAPLVEHCQIVGYLLSAWPRWSLLRAEYGLAEALPGDMHPDEVHRKCDEILKNKERQNA